MTDAVKTDPDIDAQIVNLLRENARTPLVALAKQVGLSRSATQERLKRLETRGLIAGYTIRLRDLGPAKLRAWLIIRADEGVDCPLLATSLLRAPEIRYCSSVAGSIDLLVLVETANAADLADLRDRISKTRGIANVSTHPVLKTFYDGLGGAQTHVASSGRQSDKEPG